MSEYYVSTSGNDNTPGTEAEPFGTIARGVSELKKAGDILYLRGGVYVEDEPVDIKNLHGLPDSAIVICSYPGEHAYIDGSLPQFRTSPDKAWVPAQQYDPTACEDEYVSADCFPDGVDEGNEEKAVNRGAFLDREPYTRLITYSNLNDLRADNQTFDKLRPDEEGPPGPVATDGFRRPWVYMGPGIWFNRERDSLTAGRVHIRLAHTSNQIDGLADYSEETDPRKVKLVITPNGMTTLTVRNCSYLRFENLSIRYGGERTVQLSSVKGLVFDHVRIWASTYGVRSGATTNTLFRHCTFDGGLPTWHFRIDHKAEYRYVDDGKIVHNTLGKQSARSLLRGNPNNIDTEIHHCEFVNGHDLYLIDKNASFHHNWVHNLNDEGLIVDQVDQNEGSDIFLKIKIYQNVIVKTLSSISFAGAHTNGHWYIYRNLIDLRRPTAGFRPRRPGDKEVWRYGHFPKGGPPDGPYDVFQNTFLVYAQEAEQAWFLHYRTTNEQSGNHPRRSFNNMFIAVNPDARSDKPITFIPAPSFPAQTDGNNYYRMGVAIEEEDPHRYRYLDYTYNGEHHDGGYFPSLDGPDGLCGSLLFEQSKSQYPPGYEACSIEQNPQFRRIGADGCFRETDDLRLGDASPAIGAGVKLPDELNALDPIEPPTTGNPDIGCYPYGSDPLRVGVDGRRSYPIE